MQDGEEFQTPIPQLIEYGRTLFTANWTIREGAGRPDTKGTGTPLSDAAQPLVFPRAFNRISSPDSNPCAVCHNQPYAGGGGDIVTNVFVLGQRFDFAEFDDARRVCTKSRSTSRGQRMNLDNIADSRMTFGMFGAGYIEMLARQMTADLQAIRDATPRGGSRQLISMPPSLVIRPFHRAGRVVSIREFSNNAFHQHHGMQSEERFGAGKDPDGDGVANELTCADLSAVTIFQATLPVPVEVVPKDPVVRKAAEEGKRQFGAIGCADCHIPALPLDRRGWIFTEPNPYNPPTNLRPGDTPTLSVDLTGKDLPQPHLKPDSNGVVWVPAFTDLKLHDITSGPGDPNVEPLDMQQEPGSAAFYATNSKFLTRRLWGVGNTPPYFHHGQFTTMREAILAHCGEADDSRLRFERLPAYERDSIIEFLKTLQVLPRYSVAG